MSWRGTAIGAIKEGRDTLRTRGLNHRAGCTIAAVVTVMATVAAIGIRPAAATPSAPASRYASIVMDADSGEILYERNADLPRYPASLTKIMTLYMAFEALTKKKLTLTDELPISTHAATRDPSRLNLAPGSKLKVEDAIRGMTTKSANDAACAIAEALGKGSETSFADAMTAKAKALGLKQTTFHNASGLPEDGHISSARDLAILCRALVRDYPTYYTYFSTSAFEFHGTRYPNQNRFLRTYYGADGIKTGFVNASGHNLAASAVRGGKRLIAIVLGGDTQGWTREHATRLLDVSYAKIDPSMVMVASNAAAPAAATPEAVAFAASAARASASAAATTISSAPSSTNVYPTPAGAVTIVSAPAAPPPLSSATANLKAYAAASAGEAAKGPSREAARQLASGDALQVASVAKPSAATQTPPPPPPSPTPTPKPTPPDPNAPPGQASAAAQAPSPAPSPAPTPKPTPPDPNAPPGRSAEMVVTASAQAPTPTPKPEPPAPDPKPKPSPPGAAPTSASRIPASDDDAEAEAPEALASPKSPQAAAAATSVATGDWSVQVGLFRDATVARRRGEEARNQMPLQLRGADLVVARAQDGVHVTSRLGRLSEQDAREACTQLQRGRFPCVVVPPGRPMIVATN